MQSLGFIVYLWQKTSQIGKLNLNGVSDQTRLVQSVDGALEEVSLTVLKSRTWALIPLLPVGRQLPPTARNPADQGVRRRSCSRPSHNRRRSGPVSRDRRAGRCRWETLRW